MKNMNWNKKRARLHHDWLKNSYIMFLMARVEYLDNAIESRSSVRSDVIDQFLKFQDREIELEKLIGETVDSLSPAQLVYEYPLVSMEKDNKKWLAEVVHTLYCERTGIERKVEELKNKLQTIKNLYNLLAIIIKGENGELLEKAGDKPFMKYRFEVQELSMMIASLPHEVQIV